MPVFFSTEVKLHGCRNYKQITKLRDNFFKLQELYFYQILKRIGKPSINKNEANEVIRYNDISKDSFYAFISFILSSNYAQLQRRNKESYKIHHKDPISANN